MIDTAAPRQSGFRRFLSLINLAAVSAVMLAASGCHKDSFDLDEATRPTTTTAPDPMTLPVVSIATSNTEIIEGGAVTLTITSDLAAPAGGLNVTVDISGADGMDFTSAACTSTTPPRCVVFIPSGSMSVELIITASPGDEAEGSEDWTARIIPTDTLFRINAANGEATFRINDDTLSFAVNNRLRAEYGTQTALAAGEIRNRQSDTVGGVEITGSRYDDEDGDAQIFVQDIEFAAIAAYVAPRMAIAAAAVAAQVGQGSTISDFDYAFLGDNRFNPPSTSDGRGTADYDIEGDATYRGVNFFPEGSLTMNFDAATFSGRFSVLGNSPVNYFGDANAMVPDGSGGMRTVEPTDDFDFSVNGDITGDGFEANESGLTVDTAEGFFSALSSFTSASLLGSFYDADGYNPASGNDPIEIAGAGVIENGGGINDLNFGFLGRCVADCLIGVDIAASGPSVVEGQAIMLVVTADANAPAGGLEVMFRISVAELAEFTLPGADCTTNFPICTVTIPAGMDSVNLVLTPLSDFSTEGPESWTATLMDGTNYDAAANDNAAFDITDLIAAVGIMTSDTPMEGGAAVTLTITSSETVPTTLTGGLAVTVSIRDANANEFTANAVCTNLVCIVTIPAGSDSVNLILTPLSDFSTETESWTATLEDGSNYNLDANDNVVFAITDLIANIRIMTSDTPMEGGAAVTLTITSSETVPTTLTGGLAVTVSIRDADADEFTANAVCTNLVCIVNIPAGSDSVNLILTPLSDFSTETESWTATLEDGSNYNLDANDNVVFDITDLIAAVGIMTSDTPMEGGAAVTLTITSSETVPDALIGGLNVTISIGVAEADEIQPNADCTNFPICIVNIPEGDSSVSLILEPLSDFSTETGERWTASLRDGGNYNLDANDNVGFDITDLIAAVGIMTSDTPMEGGAAVTLTITSDLAAPAGGLSVTVSISSISGNGLMTGEFTANAEADCTTNFPICIVTIPAGSVQVSLILSPLSDFSTETGERWTATLVDTGAYDPATGNENAGFAITDLIAALDILTSDTAVIEGGAIVLTITSSIDAPAGPDGGLSVTIDIVGANNADFASSAACTNPPRCVVLIPTGMRSVVLIITPLDDAAVETVSEDWTATIAPDLNDDMFTVDSNAVIAVANVLPIVTDALRLAALNAYNSPDTLTADEIRDGEDDDIAADAITGLQYDDADNNPRVLVERLDYAHLGIGINGNIDDADFVFAPLNENVVTAPASASNLGDATYALEGEMTYNGNRFYPDGELIADFINAQVSGEISLDGQEADDDFGGTTLADGTTAITNIDNLTLGLSSVADSLGASGFSGALDIITAEGFFSSLSGISTGTYSGRFNDAASYIGAAAPQEVSGSFGDITDANGNALNGGFLGQCSAGCDPPDSVGISSALIESREDGDVIVLVITSSVDAPMGGLEVNINIDGADPADFTANAEADCIFPICTVTILENTNSVNLELTPVDDSADEPTETWTATVIGGGGDFIPDPVDNAVSFDIIDTPILPAVSPDTTLANLLQYAVESGNMPMDLTAGQIRAGVDGNAGTITGSQYNNAANLPLPEIYVQRLQGHAHLGIWVNGQVPTVGEFDHDFRYAALANNAVSNLPDNGLAQYHFEADATYKGVNFFPDGDLTFNFGTAESAGLPGGNFRGTMSANGVTDNHFGNLATLPSGGGFVDGGDSLRITVSNTGGTIDTANGSFSGTWTVGTAEGFFSDFVVGTTGGTIDGRFYHSPEYVPSPTMRDPFEIAGNGMITDSAAMPNDLHFGFIGGCVLGNAFCGPGNAQLP